jgi:hypothetical protein
LGGCIKVVFVWKKLYFWQGQSVENFQISRHSSYLIKTAKNSLQKARLFLKLPNLSKHELASGLF